MTAYLKIENPGVCPVEGFTLLGATSKSETNSPYCIGQFGSGNKHAAGLLLRAKLAPIVFCSNHRLTFSTEAGNMKALEGDTRYNRIIVKHGGTDEDGKSCTFTEPLSQTEAYGRIDWDDIGMALREFVSNAIDATIKYNEINSVETKYPFEGVTVEVVEESQVRAKRGFTRVFVPLTTSDEAATETAVESFFQNKGKWFLHFSEPWLITAAILPKKNRNLDPDVRSAVIYRRGVRVREINRYQSESLFDYNLNELRVDESRNVDDYVACSAAAKALADSGSDNLALWLRSFLGETKYWEHAFDSYNMQPQWGEATEVVEARKAKWAAAIEKVGPNMVVATKEAPIKTMEAKGFKALEVPESVMRAAHVYGLKTPERVMDSDEREGREITAATPAALNSLETIWSWIVSAGMTKGKDCPPIKCFRSVMDGGSYRFGFYRDGVVYVNESLGVSLEMNQTLLEECAHFITGSLDESRDLQDWAFQFAARTAMVRSGELVAG